MIECYTDEELRKQRQILIDGVQNASSSAFDLIIKDDELCLLVRFDTDGDVIVLAFKVNYETKESELLTHLDSSADHGRYFCSRRSKKHSTFLWRESRTCYPWLRLSENPEVLTWLLGEIGNIDNTVFSLTKGETGQHSPSDPSYYESIEKALRL